jgi:hypothetical protein
MEPLNIPHHDPHLPQLFELKQHPLVVTPHRWIIMMTHPTDVIMMANILDVALSIASPTNKSECERVSEYSMTKNI